MKINVLKFQKLIKEVFQNINFIIGVISFITILSAFDGKYEYSIPLISMILPFYMLNLELKKKKQEMILSNQISSIQNFYSDVMEIYKLILHLHIRLEYVFNIKDFSLDTYKEIQTFIENIKKVRQEKGIVLISDNLFIPGEIKIIAAFYIQEIDIYTNYIQKSVIENFKNISEETLKKEKDIYTNIFNSKEDIFNALYELLGIKKIDCEKLKNKLRKYEQR